MAAGNDLREVCAELLVQAHYLHLDQVKTLLQAGAFPDGVYQKMYRSLTQLQTTLTTMKEGQAKYAAYTTAAAEIRKQESHLESVEQKLLSNKNTETPEYKALKTEYEKLQEAITQIYASLAEHETAVTPTPVTNHYTSSFHADVFDPGTSTILSEKIATRINCTVNVVRRTQEIVDLLGTKITESGRELPPRIVQDDVSATDPTRIKDLSSTEETVEEVLANNEQVLAALPVRNMTRLSSPRGVGLARDDASVESITHILSPNEGNLTLRRASAAQAGRVYATANTLTNVEGSETTIASASSLRHTT